jgi:hypothetical protein
MESGKQCTQDEEAAVAKEPVTLFTWGYWGWGNATTELVQGVDAVETGRGFTPPMFVDIRIQRTGRAEGFKGETFAKLLGPGRYRWMKSLGNRAVATRTGPAQIADPTAAEELLDLALQLHDQKQRILFFCACRYVRWEGRMNCHRDMVADLVLEAAKRRGHFIRVVEWPGGEPIELELDLSPKEWKAVLAGRQTVPLEDPVPLAELVGLPWCSVVTLCCGDDSVPIFAGPARFERKWVLPIVAAPTQLDEMADMEFEGQRSRRQIGAEARHS